MKTILIADGNEISSIPREQWEAELRGAPQTMRNRLAFMTPQHHAVRRFVVAELPRRGRPIRVDEIAGALSIPRERVASIADDLEKALFFLVRTRGEVSWAFPVTAEKTPHALTFSTGERCFAA